MNSEPGAKMHSAVGQVQSHVKGYMNQEELKQRKIDTTRISNKHMHLGSDKNAYE